MERMLDMRHRDGVVFDTARLLNDASTAEFQACILLANGMQAEAEAHERYAESCRTLAFYLE
jgi:hypothetical protein